MERLTQRDKNNVAYWNGVNGKSSSDIKGNIYGEAITKLAEYEDAEEQGLLLKVDPKDELIEVLATKLLHSEFGSCYMCKNPMKNITLDGVNNGCDGQCSNEETTVDDFLKKIVSEIEYKKKQALKQMGVRE